VGSGKKKKRCWRKRLALAAAAGGPLGIRREMKAAKKKEENQ